MTPSRATNLVLAVLILIGRAAGIAVAADLDPALLPPPAATNIDFARDIQPVLETSCQNCHGREKAKNGLRLDSRERALAGGDDGLDLVPGDSARSRLIHYVARLVPDLEMPPAGKGDPLTAHQVGLLRAWIDQGAKWAAETNAGAAPGLADRSDWWSLKPLVQPAVPPAREPAPRIRNPIDSFIAAKLAAEHLTQSPEADRRTLIRRVSFDLTGLPPAPADIEQFLADADPLAYEHLVDRLLDSPRYGECWARHWLDVVHYGETHGYDKDQPRPNAWPYRDYVIRSLNSDKPYGRFVQEQVAGDVLFPDTRDGIEALGFIAAGPWDLIGHAEVPESKIDGQVARHLDRDDMVVNTMQTFNSLTVQCAQCHNHKFDPIPQEDYYRLQAVFAAVDRADQKYDADPAVARQRRDLEGHRAALTKRQQEINAAILVRAGPSLPDLDRQIAALESAEKPGEAFGYHSAIAATAGAVKWVQVDLGRSVPLDAIVLHPCKDDFNGIGEGFGFPVRYKIEVSDDTGFLSGVILISDHTGADLPNPKLEPQVAAAGGRAGRYVRVTATKLAPRQNDYILALAEIEAFDRAGTNVARGVAVSALDSIEAPARWRKSNLTDGWYPGGVAAGGAKLADLRHQRADLLAQATSVDERKALALLGRDLAEVDTALAKLPPRSTAYVAAVHHGSGSFAGTGASGGKPRPIRILTRGNVQKPGREVGPGALSCLPGLPARFDLAPGHGEGEGRAALAGWLSDRSNPLTWRSIVNRVWLHHFGRGLVDTPNDFGHMGGLPSHPELLDWLAAEFRDHGQSLKALHRLMVTSATYRQTSTVVPAFARTDSDNRYLWRMNRRKLEAEALRDTMLLVAGKLDLKMGGPGFQDFVIQKPENSPHYEYELHDPNDPAANRRSIYRFIVRSQQQPFMTALDCADPSMQVAKRNETVSPLQALALLNDSFVLARSKDFATRLEPQPGGFAAALDRGFLEAIGRSPTPAEHEALAAYARDFGPANCCRVIFNLNEFAFVD